MTLKNIIALARATIVGLALTSSALTATTAHASADSLDQSDLWWNSSESGWGVQLAHRGRVIFATMYVYDAGGKPTWVTALLLPTANGWSGDLYVTTGPWFGAASFDPNSVTRRIAGTMTWMSADGVTGTIAYTIDGVSVSKNVTRQLLDVDNYAGRYMGGISFVNSCTGVQESFVNVTVTQVNQNISVNWTNEATRDTCSFFGTLSQQGQFGKFVGTFGCSPVHDDGEFTFYELRVTPQSISGRYESYDPDIDCRTSGYLSGVRRR